MHRYRSRWLYPGDTAPLQQAGLTIDGGRIVSIDTDVRGDVTDLGDVAILPGLVNAHTHLEFSSLTHPLQPLTEFPAWIHSLIAWRRQPERSGQPWPAIRRGLEESLRSGTTSLGEIATSDWVKSLSLMDASTVPGETAGPPGSAECVGGTIFRELLGLGDAAAADQLQLAERFLEVFPLHSGFRPGLSPHAPYSVHPELFEGVCRLAERVGVPVAMHLAESPAELELLARGTGPLVELLKELGVWRPGLIPFGTRPRDYIERLARLPRASIVHGNLLDRDDIELVAASKGLSVIYCPRTHAAMQTGTHPWREMQAAGINVALGTDSRASNPDLSLWHELQFLHARHPEIPASNLIRMATVNAARAIGIEHAGHLRPGATADLCFIRLSPEAAADPQSHLLSSDCRIVNVLRAGCIVDRSAE